jgi:malonyl CoA-acyl carrier protein transacylase/NADP-dependent 3-hydroxy acid dehydrogenase YdfG
LDRVDVVQPVLFAVMVSLAELWCSCGVVPVAVVGHSQGEIAAACVAGGLSLGDAARVVALRSRALTALSGQGGMASVSVTPAAADDLLLPWDGRLSVAAVNGPRTVVISGDADALDELVAHCEREAVRIRRIAVDYASHSVHVEQLGPELADVLSPVHPTASEIDLVSTVTGDRVDTTTLDAGYWYRNLRDTVEFEAAIRTLAAKGHNAFIEISPRPVLSAGLHDTLDDIGSDACVVASLRPDEGWRGFLRSVAEAYVQGVPVDWQPVFGGQQAHSVELPTYPFQRRPFWLHADDADGDGPHVSVVPLAGADGVLVTAAIGRRRPWWLTGDALSEPDLLPEPVLVDLLLGAGQELGWPVLDRLTLARPVPLPEDAAVHLQFTVAAPEDRRRAVTLHHRVEDGPWQVTGDGALAQDLEDLADTGGGPDDRVDVRLAEGRSRTPEGFGLHPALLDEALRLARTPDETRPLDWRGVVLHATGAEAVRARFDGASGALSLTDGTGAPVLTAAAVEFRSLERQDTTRSSADSLFRVDWTRRPLRATRRLRCAVLGTDPAATRTAELRGAVLGAGNPVDEYTGLDQLASAVAGGDVLPDLVIAPVPAGPGVPDPDAVRAVVGQGLRLVRRWLADDMPPTARLVLLTSGAVAVDGGSDVTDPAQTALWGLVRSAQSEHPGRIVLADVDVDEASLRALPTALDHAVESGEPQIALRRGEVAAPRLVRAGRNAGVAELPADPTRFDRQGTVLVTGAAGALGSAVARHLVSRHGIRHLLLTGRRGAGAAGATELVAELTDLGAQVVMAACDVADRGQVADLLASVPEEHPITAVVHAAGVLDDGIVLSLTDDQVDTVFRPKVDAVVNLHELTRDLKLTTFVVFSSAAATFGSPGQGNYAAANAFLDAMVEYRRAQGLPGLALAWGFWSERGGMTGGLREVDLKRMSRNGLLPLTEADGLSLLDDALAGDDPVLVPARLDLRVWRGENTVPALLRSLVRPAARRVATTTGGDATSSGSLVERLAALPGPDREAALLDVVRRHAAAVLGHPGPEAVPPGRGFLDSGFDSLSSVELRNRLAVATGHRLPTTLLFDHPTPLALVRHLNTELGMDTGPDVRSLSDDVARIEHALTAMPTDDTRRTGLVRRLEALLGRVSGSGASESPDDLVERFRSSTSDELFDLLDQELGG